MAQIKKKVKSFFHVVSGYFLYENGMGAPFQTEMTMPLIQTDTQFKWLKKYLITEFKVKDALVFNIIILHATRTEAECMADKAEAIANDRDCTPPHEKNSNPS